MMEEFKEKTTSEQKEHTGMSDICQKHLQDFQENIRGLTKQKLIFLEGFSHMTSVIKPTAFQKRNIIATVKYGGSSVMVWAVFLSQDLYQNIPKENVWSSVQDLQQSRLAFYSRTMVQNTQVQMKILEWPSQSPDLNTDLN